MPDFVFHFRCIELEILASTYKPDTVPALKRISSHLKTSVASVSKEIERTKLSLRQYEAVGEDFEQVVKEYADVKTEIRGKEWAIKELRESAKS